MFLSKERHESLVGRHDKARQHHGRHHTQDQIGIGQGARRKPEHEQRQQRGKQQEIATVVLPKWAPAVSDKPKNHGSVDGDSRQDPECRGVSQGDV